MKPHRIFLSSTSQDLTGHRERIVRALEEIGQSVERMEVLGARPSAPLEECVRLASSCDALVVVVAHRYGWIPDATITADGGSPMSVTWHEVRAAERAGRPVFAFIVDAAAEWSETTEQDLLPDAKTEREALEIWRSVRALDAFKRYLSSEYLRSTFDTPEDLAAKVATSVGRWLIEETQQESEDGEDRAELDSYLRALVARYQHLSWTKEAIELRVCRRESSGSEPAAAALLDWACVKAPGRAFLMGEFGSGKTGLMQWLASELAAASLAGRSGVPLPIYIDVGRLRGVAPRSESLRLLTDPTIPASFESPACDPSIVLLDSLDELLGAVDASSDQLEQTIRAVHRMFPAATRVLAACRTPVFAPVSRAVRSALVAEADRDADVAIDHALGLGPRDERFEVLEIPQSAADRHISSTDARSIWEEVCDQEAFRQFSRSPFTLRLLERALPQLRLQRGSIGLDDLYRVAVDSWLRFDHGCSESERDLLLARLESLAVARRTGLSMTDADKTLMRAGLVRQHGEDIVFSHYSYGEYFLARFLLRQLLRYDASYLSRLNLVAAYNTNRFLVPMIRKKLSESRRNASPSRGSASGRARFVTTGEYNAFVRRTGWRRTTGYGIHPHHGEADFTSGESLAVPWTRPEDPLRAGFDEPVANVSWYDIALYCMWIGGGFPDTRDLAAFSSARLAAWGDDWFDERRAHVSVYHCDEEGDRILDIGVNPDYRSSLIGAYLLLPDR